ncbi:DoxX family protein [Nocardia sp. CDC160]|uniref:DoxX family protein n=1 Tax=Nocardia sp. CDC160 TaxID=3112166 RepID=UPI002DBD7E58|nr:DoxX family protein [Nocardia sp. CDC160]MEC3914969.1 DoxX family protein [Nocardia sp. CDC160]
MRMNKARWIGYWTTTVVLGFVWISGGGADLIHRDGTEGGMVALGYPTYVLTILGFWKILGALAILAPKFPLVKEWAYAGTFFELTGAFASHLASHSAVSHLIYTGTFVLCAIASWALRPADRMLDIPALRRLRPTDDHTSVRAPVPTA